MVGMNTINRRHTWWAKRIIQQWFSHSRKAKNPADAQGTRLCAAGLQLPWGSESEEDVQNRWKKSRTKKCSWHTGTEMTQATFISTYLFISQLQSLYIHFLMYISFKNFLCLTVNIYTVLLSFLLLLNHHNFLLTHYLYQEKQSFSKQLISNLVYWYIITCPWLVAISVIV